MRKENLCRARKTALNCLRGFADKSKDHSLIHTEKKVGGWGRLFGPERVNVFELGGTSDPIFARRRKKEENRKAQRRGNKKHAPGPRDKGPVAQGGRLTNGIRGIQKCLQAARKPKGLSPSNVSFA